MVEILVPLGLFAMIFGIVQVIAERKVKLTLIQHGADAKTLKMNRNANSSLKFGLLLVGISAGILLGNIIAASTNMQEEIAYFSMTFLCGGISLLIYYALTKAMTKNQAEDSE